MDIITDLLNLPQESILDVSSRIENDILLIQFTIKPFHCNCPIYGVSVSRIKEYKIERIKHSSLNHRKCVIKYHARCLICNQSGKTFYENNPFVPPETIP